MSRRNADQKAVPVFWKDTGEGQRIRTEPDADTGPLMKMNPAYFDPRLPRSAK